MAAIGDLVDADQTRPARRSSSRWSATTRATIGPIVCQPTRSSRAIGANAICCASHATDVFEVARVVRARPRPRHRLQTNAAVAAAQPAQLALDDAAARAQIQVPPALDAPIVDLQVAAGLAAARADPPPAPQPDGHDHPLAGEADVDHGRPGQAEQPLECRADAHVALLREPLISTTSSLLRGRRRVARVLRNLRELLCRRETPAQARNHAADFTPKSSGDPYFLARTPGRDARFPARAVASGPLISCALWTIRASTQRGHADARFPGRKHACRTALRVLLPFVQGRRLVAVDRDDRIRANAVARRLSERSCRWPLLRGASELDQPTLPRGKPGDGGGIVSGSADWAVRQPRETECCCRARAWVRCVVLGPVGKARPVRVAGRGEVGPVVADPFWQLRLGRRGRVRKPAEVAPDERVLARQLTLTASWTQMRRAGLTGPLVSW